jgi:hypothetical protein
VPKHVPLAEVRGGGRLRLHAESAEYLYVMREPSRYSDYPRPRNSKSYYTVYATRSNKSRKRRYPAHINRCYEHICGDDLVVRASDVRRARRSFRVSGWLWGGCYHVKSRHLARLRLANTFYIPSFLGRDMFVIAK